MEVEIAIRNYRCFSEKRPAKFTIRDGETAFVGKNNAGKSTVLKMFYELRGLFQNLPTLLLNGLSGLHGGFAPSPEVGDVNNLFHDQNDGVMELVFKVNLGGYSTSPFFFANPFNPDTHDVPTELSITIPRDSSGMQFKLTRPDGSPVGPGKGDPFTFNEDGKPRPLFLGHITDAMACLAETYYIGPFRNVLPMSGKQKYFDITIGNQVIIDWESMKNGSVHADWRVISDITEMLRKIFDFSTLDISANFSRDDFIITIDGKRYLLSSIGAGFAQFLLMFASIIKKKPRLILIDEPELNLHPALQSSFVTTLRSFASNGVLFATHNIGLARTVAERIYIVRRMPGGCSEIHEWDRSPRLSQFIGEMGFSAYQELGFQKLLLVEGPTEVKAVQQILRLFGKDHKVVVFPLGGDGMIVAGRELELQEAKRITDEVYILIDSERQLEDAPLKSSRNAFVNSCAASNITCHVTHLRATENYFTDAAVKKTKSIKYRALGPYERLEDSPDPKWGKNENWLIAREMSAADWRENDVGKFLDSL